MALTAVLLIASFVILVIFFIFYSKAGNTPPGPIGLPIVGYIPYLGKKPYVVLQELAKVYGPVFSIQLGSQNVIVLDDYQSMKDAFAQDAFMGRPPESPFFLNKETLETGAFNDLPWKEQRRFSLHVLKDLGFGRSDMEDMLKEEIHDILEAFEKTGGHPISLKSTLSPSTSNNIATLVFGKRMKHDDPKRIKLNKSLNETGAAAGQVAWQLFFPWVTKLLSFFNFRPEAKIAKLTQYFKDFTRNEISEHERTLDENNIRDYIDGYLLEIRKRKEKAFCKEVLEDMVGAFFGAGSETVQQSVNWLMLAMAGHPEVQKKVHSEIDNIIGADRMPSWTDNPKMPYTQAVITELMRWRTIVPLNVLRYTLKDTELNGYFIPKHTYILSNIWSVHHNPKYWGGDVEEFRPERFLSKDGTEFVKSEYFIPFSIGKRACPGESFARIETYLYFVSILQKFKVSLPEGSTPCFDGNLGISLAPKPYDICMNKRI